MGLEAATFINQLVATNPVGATDPRSQGDDHIRLLKLTLQNTFPNITNQVTANHTELNQLHNSVITSLSSGAVGAPTYSFAGDTDTGMWRGAANSLRLSAGGVLALQLDPTFVAPGLVVLNLDGTNLAPSYSFFNDPDTGVYRIGSGVIGFALNGTLKNQFYANGQGGPDGLFTQPAYSFINDSDTGIYSRAANQLGFSTNGVGQWFIDANGGLTSESGAKFLYVADGAAATPGVAFALDGDTGFYRTAANGMALACAGAASLVLDTQQAYFLDGPSAVNPGIAFILDTNTGIRRSAADTLDLVAGSSAIATFDNVTGGVGQIRLRRQVYLDVNSSASATTGAGSALPANPQGYFAITINGTQMRVPYYNN